jgi:hypothetical protein
VKTIPYESLTERANEVAKELELTRAKQQAWRDSRMTLTRWLKQRQARLKELEAQDEKSEYDDWSSADWDLHSHRYSLDANDWQILEHIDDGELYLCCAVCLEVDYQLSYYSRLCKLTIVSTPAFERVVLKDESIRNVAYELERLSLKIRAALLEDY